jgi:CheY-like chemotaxis protein
MPTSLRCLIVEDQLMFLELLQRLLERQPGLEVVATASTVAAGVAACRLHRPDLLILDLTLADGDGGFPGRRQIIADYAVSGAALTLTLSATTDAPTLMESGFDVNVQNWRMVAAAPGLSDEQKATVAADIDKLVNSAGWKAMLESKGWANTYLAGADFDAQLAKEIESTTAVPMVPGQDRIINGRRIPAPPPLPLPPQPVPIPGN